MTGYINREIAGRVREALASMPAVVLTGMRQSGKSTFLQNDAALKRRRYYSLDRFADLEGIKRNVEEYLRPPDPVTIDEAQRHPGLMEAIKEQVDREGQVPGRFLLSGSANFSLLRGVTETLAGRAIYLEMLPMSRREILRRTRSEPFIKSFFDDPDILRTCPAGKRVTEEDVLRGGMPRIALRSVRDAAVWFQGYEQTYLERDVRQLSQVADLIAFRRGIRLAALRTGKILKISEVARDAQIPVNTPTRYLGVMEASCLLWRLPPFSGNPSSRLIKSPKLHWSDSGLAAHLSAARDISPSADSMMRGPLFETWVAQNLQSILSAKWPEAKLHYWSVQGRHEVDFVIGVNHECLAIEVKTSSRWNENDLTGLKAFLGSTPKCRAAILAYSGNSIVPLGNRLYALPLDLVVS